MSCVRDQINVRSCLVFEVLWSKHPLNWRPIERFPFRRADGTPLFEDQCAIKMSIALQLAGLSLKSFRGAAETHAVASLKSESFRAALRAEELAQWLMKVLGAPEHWKPDQALEKVRFRKGIIFFKDFWVRTLGPGRVETAANRSGDHIDVWDGHTLPDMPTVDSPYFAGWRHYFEKAREVWFWELR